MKYLTENKRNYLEIGNGKQFLHPAFFGNLAQLVSAIDGAGLKRPNSEDVADLVYDAFQDKNEKYSAEIIKILEDLFLREFTGNLYLPKRDGEEVHNGVIVESNPSIIKGRTIMDKNSLIKRLQSNDPLVKFVPFGFKTGELPKKGFGKNDYNIARYGEERADKIEQVASQYKFDPVLNVFNSVDKEIVRGSALYSSGSIVDGDRLYLDGYDWDDGGNGYAFGVSREALGAELKESSAKPTQKILYSIEDVREALEKANFGPLADSIISQLSK